MKITLEHLTKVFENKKAGRRVVAVNDLNVVIPSGKLIGLLGPSGCGKSTTLFMLSGLDTPTSGKILFGEDDVTDLAPEKRGIGLVFQNYALYPHMTVEQNIMFPLLNMRVKKEEARTRAAEAAKMVQIEDLLLRKPSELSGGQQQRVAIARALVKFPSVLLLDEPLSNLDARLRLQTREEIRRIQKETGITTVFVTHDQEEAMSICDSMLVMKLGVLQQAGVPQNIYDDPANLFVANFLGTPPINIFLGEIKNHKVYIGDEAIQDTTLDDQEVYVGIRPEGFIVDEKGPLTLLMDHIDVMGRDKSIVSEHPASTKPSVRSIIDADVAVPATKTVKFSLKANKVFLFNRETEVRLREVKVEGSKANTEVEVA
ncbi:MAG: ABC transporter ATP-binding protein [Acholeplasmatales bacterium]|nr:ABC transporter ATP-binding protein [Acholeplasmatales bacterium]